MYDRFKQLRIERRAGGVLVVTIDNPPMNAITADIHHELPQLFQQVNWDDETRVIVLTGAGTRAFSAGGDFNTLKRGIEKPDPQSFLEGKDLLYALLNVQKPIIARVNGHAIGLGATLALGCDLVYMVKTAKIADPHVKIGLVAGDGGALLWPLLIGYSRAKEFLLTGDHLTGEDAARIGLINRAVAAEQLDEVVFAMANRLSSGTTKAINWTKTAVNMLLRRQMEGLVEAHLAVEFMSLLTQDHREAVDAALEKREPKFVGR